jgi:hypothetical protein
MKAWSDDPPIRLDGRSALLLEPTRAGTLVHCAVAVYARQTPPRDPRAATAVVLERFDTRGPALRARLLTALLAYDAYLDDTSVLVGCEILVGDQRLDVVWRDRDRVWADEVKSGAISRRDVAQARAQVLVARERWPQFQGVRLLSLQHRRRSLFVSHRDPVT